MREYMAANQIKTIPFIFGEKHRKYIRSCSQNTFNIAEGAVRAGKTIDNVFAFAHELRTTRDRIHLATGSTSANAKLNIGDANGFGLEWIFRNQCHWGKYRGNECLYIHGPYTGGRQHIVIFAGAAKADSYKKIRGNSYGLWIATEINLHHDNTIKEAFNRQLAAKNRKVFWDLNPDHPAAKIYTDYIDKYKRLEQEGTLLGGYNYQHFTIFDNETIPQERIDEIISQYDKASIWYQRDILGRRCVAEGLIYRSFADAVTAGSEMFQAPDKLPRFRSINIGVDIGGNGSGHAFVCTGITPNMELYGLESERHFGDIDADALSGLFVSFVNKVIAKYATVTFCCCDSAEQVIRRSLQSALNKNGLGWIRVDNSYKEQINERIQATLKLMAQGRFFITEYAGTLRDALSTAVWNPKVLTSNERLDDGTSDIDSLDAFEYTFDRQIKQLIAN